MQLCEGCELVEGVFEKALSGLWYLNGETGLVGRLSDSEQVPVGPSQYLESSESSDIGEYCKDRSSLEKEYRRVNEDSNAENFSPHHKEMLRQR